MQVNEFAIHTRSRNQVYRPIIYCSYEHTCSTNVTTFSYDSGIKSTDRARCVKSDQFFTFKSERDNPLLREHIISDHNAFFFASHSHHTSHRSETIIKRTEKETSIRRTIRIVIRVVRILTVLTHMACVETQHPSLRIGRHERFERHNLRGKKIKLISCEVACYRSTRVMRPQALSLTIVHNQRRVQKCP